MKIVAPAGSIERFYAAIKGGAEEIYMGIKGFGARRNAVNLTIEEYKEALDYAHLRGVRVFLTLNTIMMDAEIEAIYHNLNELYKHGLDAVIVQDLGLAKFIKENFEDLELHGSTQMTVANHVEANYLKSIGFKRVVLPRELSFDEIKKVRENTDIELEIFVSGALCISYSGNCYLSSFIGGRSGNRGMCAQPCRKKYTSDEKELGYFLSPKDQYLTYNEILKLKEIGIESIKLEGRMKEPNYVFQIVSYYRDAINEIRSKENFTQIFNRGYSKGFFYSQEKSEIMNNKIASHIGVKIGEIKPGKRTIKLLEKVILGDGLTYLDKNFEKIGGGYINRIDTPKEKGKKVGEIGDEIFLSNITKDIKYVYRNFSKEISDITELELKKVDSKKPILLSLNGKVGENLEIKVKTINENGLEIFIEKKSEEIIEEAKNKATTKEVLIEKLLETGDTTFTGKIENIVIDENIFIPLSLLKKVKREVLDELSNNLVISYRKNQNKNVKKLEKIDDEKTEIIFSAIVRNGEQENAVKKLGIFKIYNKSLDVAREENLSKIDLKNKLAGNLYQILENKNEKITVSWNMNISNRYALDAMKDLKNVDTIILSPEISYRRIEEIGKTEIKKAILGYGKPRGMYIELPLTEDKKIIENEQNDKFTVIQNEENNTEIYLEKPINIFKDLEYLKEIGISEFVMEFVDETAEEIEEIWKNRFEEYRPYNYEKGVF